MKIEEMQIMCDQLNANKVFDRDDWSVRDEGHFDNGISQSYHNDNPFQLTPLTASLILSMIACHKADVQMYKDVLARR